MQPEIWKARVQIGGLTHNDPPLLAFSQIAVRPDGKRKLISQMVQVIDTDLLSRLRRVRQGEEAEVTVEQHSTFSVLTEFVLLDKPALLHAAASV